MIASFQDILSAIARILNLIVPFLFSLALLYFLWGLAGYISRSGDEKAKVEGKSRMIWGIVGLFVMFSVWGIIQILQGELGVGSGNSSPLPVLHKSLN